MSKVTPLIESHRKLKGKIVDFAGWLLPVEFSGLIDEHNFVRNKVGIFDVSHMGEIYIKGNDAKKFVQYLVTNNINKLIPGKILYTPMCYQDGGIIDDLLVYMMDSNEFLLVVNASNIEKDFKWIKENKLDFDVEITNNSEDYFQIAVQGPESGNIIQKVFNVKISDIKYFNFIKLNLDNTNCIVSRTGYTGSDGFEIYGNSPDGLKIWEKLIEAGAKPCGLGARDTLRLEAGLMLYGNDLSKDTTPLEAGLNFTVKLDCEDFIGRSALLKQEKNGVKKKLTGLRLFEKAIPRNSYNVLNSENEIIGKITSGTLSPTKGIPIALAYIDTKALESNTELFIQIRKNILKAGIVKLPFLKNC